MNEPHVEWLSYRLELGPGLTITNPPPLEHETEHFKLKLDASRLTVSMKEHHASRESAEENVRPFLRGWEIDNSLAHGPGAFRFMYEDASVIDLNPPPPEGSRSIRVVAGAMSIIGGRATLSATGSVVRRAYPAPPTNFLASPNVETLWYRYEMYREGKEPLASMAYFCLTLINALGGGRDGAASMFNVSRPVLHKFSYLTSERGDTRTGRKYSPRSMPLGPKEELDTRGRAGLDPASRRARCWCGSEDAHHE